MSCKNMKEKNGDTVTSQKQQRKIKHYFFLYWPGKSLYCLVGVSVCAGIIVEGAEAKLYQQKLSRTLLKGKQPLNFKINYWDFLQEEENKQTF